MSKSKDDDKEDEVVKPEPKPDDKDNKDKSPDCQPGAIGIELGNIFQNLTDTLRDACVNKVLGGAKELKLNGEECTQALQKYFNKDGPDGKPDANNYENLTEACGNALKAFKPASPNAGPQEKQQSSLEDQLRLRDLTAGYSQMGLKPEEAEKHAQVHHGQEKAGNTNLEPKDVVNAFVQSGGNPDIAAIRLAENKAPDIAGEAMSSKKPKSPFDLPTPSLPGTKT